MSKEEHRIFFSSAYCEKSSEHFLINLPFSLDLSGKWKCTIRDIYLSVNRVNFSPEYIYILGDFCETSIIQGKKQLPILKQFYFQQNKKYYSYDHPLYIPLKQNSLNKIELRFLDKDLKDIDFGEKYLIECCLHFYKHG